MSYFNSVGHVNLFLNIACIMNGVTKKQRLTKQNPLKVFYYNNIIEVNTFNEIDELYCIVRLISLTSCSYQ